MALPRILGENTELAKFLGGGGGGGMGGGGWEIISL